MPTSWIWTPLDDGERNLIVRFRRVFSYDPSLIADNLTAADPSPTLRIAAENRYLLYVNGVRIGEGPVKGFPWHRFYDTYDLADLLAHGKNTIGVIVYRFGISSGRSYGGQGGLWLELDSGARRLLQTDDSWRVGVAPFKRRRVRRMAMGMEYCDVHDMRREDDWLAPGYREEPRRWTAAVPVELDWGGDASGDDLQPSSGGGFWERRRFDPSPVSPLTRDRHYPISVREFRSVRVPECRVAVDLRDLMRAAGVPDHETGPVHGYMVTELHAREACVVTMERMNPSFDLDTFGALKVNGAEIQFDVYGRATLPVESGVNLLVVRIDRVGQSFPSWVFGAEFPLELRAPSPLNTRPLCVMISKRPVHPDFFARPSAVAFAAIATEFSTPPVVDDPFAETWAVSGVTFDGASAAQPGPLVADESAMLHDSSTSTFVEPEDGADAEFLLDFGEETVGYLCFDILGSAGTVVDMVGFEAMLDGLRVRTDNLNNSVRVTLRDGVNHFQSAVRLGFRYLVVTIRGEPVKIRSISVLRAVRPVNYRGSFQSSDPLLDSIWAIGRRTVELCMDDTYVDCPAYEASFWVGDARTSSLVAQVAFGDHELARRSIHLAADTLRSSRLVNALVPSPGATVIPNWSLLWAITIWEHYHYTGDQEALLDMLPALVSQSIEICESIEENGLFRFPAWNMMDWAEMDLPPNCYPATESAWAARALDISARAIEAVGIEAAGAVLRVAPTVATGRFTAAAASLRRRINELLWSESDGGYRDSIHPDGSPGAGFSQQTQIVCLLAGVVTADRRDTVERSVLETPHGWTGVASPWMMWFRLEALAQLGLYDAILQTIREYWGEMVRQGATTCWETFSSFFQGRWAPTRSWCHGWSTAPTWFLSTYQLGVSWDEPGAQTVTVAPVPGDLRSAQGIVPTVRGDVAVRWDIAGDAMNLAVTAPPGTKVVTRVPAGITPGEIRVTHR